MTLRIADTFTDSLARLAGPEQAAAKQAAFDLQVNPAAPGLSLHRVDRARDKDFWTARANRDIRIVLHKRAGDVLLAWVGHHDDAYAWAERRRLDTHPTTGAAQLIEIRERVEEIIVPIHRKTATKPPLFAATPEPTLLLCGVPPDWLADVRLATEDSLFDLATHLPSEAVEALLNLAVGVAPAPATPPADPFAHPDAQRRFRLLVDEEELRLALEFPWDRWTIFLHPSQREFVARDFAGPARITGSAGTGKTVVALHRAVRLARDDPSARVLLTTYNAILAEYLRQKLTRLAGADIADSGRVTVTDLQSAALDAHRKLIGPVQLATEPQIRAALAAASANSGVPVEPRFLFDEWSLVVDARNLRDLAAYQELPRLGRRTRLTSDRRHALWSIFATARADLAAKGLKTYAEALHDAAEAIGVAPPYDHVVVDEAQDITVAELRFLKAACTRQTNGLFFAGDIGQRIFRPSFSWSAEGVEVRGRSRTLKVNYRTSRQIRRRSDRLLPSRLVELDGSEEDRTGVQSVFEGPRLDIRTFATPEDEIAGVAEWIGQVLKSGVAAKEIGVFVRSADELNRAKRAIKAAGADADILEARGPTGESGIILATMHLAKGLEFRAVVVMACDASVVPSERRLFDAIDETALAEVFATERHLFYVACTRARERLMISGVSPISDFFHDVMDTDP